MNIQDDQKLEVTLSQLQERYAALHKMRERSTNFAVWILGLGLGIGWLLISKVKLGLGELVLLVLLIIFMWCQSRHFLNSMEGGFICQRDLIIKLERILGLFTDNIYSPKAVLPAEFENIQRKNSDHFQTLNRLLSSVFIFLLLISGFNFMKLREWNFINASGQPESQESVQGGANGGL